MCWEKVTNSVIRVLEKTKKPDVDADQSICQILSEKAGFVLNNEAAWADWEYFSGDMLFPVEHPVKMPHSAWWTELLWEGEYGRQRLLLCEHILDKFRQVYRVEDFEKLICLPKIKDHVIGYTQRLATATIPDDLAKMGICSILHEKFGIVGLASCPNHPYASGAGPLRIASWKKYSGNTKYPVPSIDPSLSAHITYVSIREKWIGEYGKLRRMYASHISRCVSEMTDEEFRKGYLFDNWPT